MINAPSSFLGMNLGNGGQTQPQSTGNVFSPQGLKAQEKAYGTGGDNPLAPIARESQAGLYGGIAQGTQFANNLEPQREGILNNMLGYQSVGGIQSEAARAANAINQNAAQSGNRAALALQGMGYSSGAAGGALASSYQQGANQVNASNQHFYDPAYISSVLQGAYGTVLQGQQNPLLQQAAALEPIITGQNATNYAQRGQGLLGAIAPIAGQIMGGPLGSRLLGGGSSSQGPSTVYPQDVGAGPTYSGSLYPSQNTPGPWAGGYVPYQ